MDHCKNLNQCAEVLRLNNAPKAAALVLQASAAIADMKASNASFSSAPFWKGALFGFALTFGGSAAFFIAWLA